VDYIDEDSIYGPISCERHIAKAFYLSLESSAALSPGESMTFALRSAHKESH
jgi:hypothetical protein